MSVIENSETPPPGKTKVCPGSNVPQRHVADRNRIRAGAVPELPQQISLAFGVTIDKDMVRRILSVHYRPESDSGSPSWLTFLGHMKDSLWSCDLFRCEGVPRYDKRSLAARWFFCPFKN
jgi:hypothetical protein